MSVISTIPRAMIRGQFPVLVVPMVEWAAFCLCYNNYKRVSSHLSDVAALYNYYGRSGQAATLSWSGFEDARPLSELADAGVLRDGGARKEVVAAFHVALGCVEADPERRPRMKAVAESLDKIGS
ncbi:hypothetical protein OsI_35885 [Oryza sativa Indica Group]|uniref:Uncharacterized protein n=1 Tax=Oryza sativa subsp. indica TaxID=39946 RepID=B8BK63_ORYSI|nr:hypothetical protein OsI_35885 [Oryza sativa Indica Group]